MLFILDFVLSVGKLTVKLFRVDFETADFVFDTLQVLINEVLRLHHLINFKVSLCKFGRVVGFFVTLVLKFFLKFFDFGI